MRHHRKLIIFCVILFVIVAVGSVVYYRIARPARAVLLLPEGNFLLYVNFSPAHFFDLGPMPAAESEPEYQDFVQNTGFHFEHDLDTIAFSVRNPEGNDPESSAVFNGKFDHDRLTSYLQRRSTDTEKYAGKDIFVLHQANHLVRACLLDSSTVAVTNMQSPEPMHTIIDKSRNSGLIGNGPSLIENYHRYVPFGSLAWAMFRSSGKKAQLEGWDMDFLQNSVSIASVRYTGSIRLKLEIFSDTAADAQQVLKSANIFLVMVRGAAENLGQSGSDKDVKAAFDSVQVQQNDKRTQITATIPQGFVKKIGSTGSIGPSSR